MAAMLKAKIYLAKLKSLHRILISLEREINCLEASAFSLGSLSSGSSGMGNHISDKTSDAALKLMEADRLRGELSTQTKEYGRLKAAATKLINALEDSRHQKVLNYYYLHDLTLEDTAGMLGRSYQHTCNLRNKALAELELLMERYGIG